MNINKKENILQKTKERLKQGFDDIKPSKNHDNKDFEEKQNIIEINKDGEWNCIVAKCIK